MTAEDAAAYARHGRNHFSNVYGNLTVLDAYPCFPLGSKYSIPSKKKEKTLGERTRSELSYILLSKNPFV